MPKKNEWKWEHLEKCLVLIKIVQSLGGRISAEVLILQFHGVIVSTVAPVKQLNLKVALMLDMPQLSQHTPIFSIFKPEAFIKIMPVTIKVLVQELPYLW